MPDTLASRGGLKLQAAIDHFDLRGRVRGARAIDVGASTGGFTEVLLRQGAAAVTAIEVGHGQMVERLRRDPRVKLLERTDFKTLSVHVEPGPFDFFTVDVSFVAARSMLRGLAFRLRPGARGVVLVKPQFELPRHQVKGGDVSAPALRARALASFTRKAERLGFRVRQVIDSPVAGGEGTVELLAHLELVERSAVLPAPGEKRPAAPAPAVAPAAARRERWFVVAAPGLEPVVAAEAEHLPGVRRVQAVDGGVELDGDLATGMAANLRLRAATRVLLRAGELRAREFSKLRRLVAKLPWERWVPREPARPVRVQASASRCRLYHTGAVAEAVLAGMGDRLKVTLTAAKGRAPDGDDGSEAADPATGGADELRVLARGVEDMWTLSVDSSGELLHRRGWRTEAGAAPLRETLAAGVLALAGYDPARPLLDPMCGAGTIALEAAAWARGRAPGAGRRFAFERWPGFDPESWERLRAGPEAVPDGPDVDVDVDVDVGPPRIWAWDRDPRAIERVRANAERAGLADALVLAVARLGGTPGVDPPAALAELQAASAGVSGLVVVNPPYGKRLGSPAQAARLVRALGRTLRAGFAGWRAAVLLPDVRWASALALADVQRHPLRNGGLRVHLVVGTVPGPGSTRAGNHPM